MGKGLAAAFNMLLEPGAGAEAAKEKWAWVGPLVLLAVVTTVIGWMLIPTMQDVFLNHPPENLSREQAMRAQESIGKFAKFGVFASPIIVGVTTAIGAGLILAMCSILGMRVNFLELFNLTSMAGLIKTIAAVAGMAVIKIKGDIQSMEELKPALGLDIFLPDDTNKILRAVLNYFSVFEVWYLVVLALAIAATYKVNKGKGFGAITPIWLFALLFAVVGALFR